MNSIDNSGFININQNPKQVGFAPAVTFSYNTGTKALTITEASAFGTGDTFDNLNIGVFDAFGNKKEATITAAAGNVVISLATGFNPVQGFNITATLVSTLGNKANLSAYGVNTTIAPAGSLTYINKSY